MTERQRVDVSELKVEIHRKQGGLCWNCHMPVFITQMQLAHRLADTKANRKRWGQDVVHTSAVGTHPTADCNDGVLLNPDSLMAEDLARSLRREIRRKGRS